LPPLQFSKKKSAYDGKKEGGKKKKKIGEKKSTTRREAGFPSYTRGEPDGLRGNHSRGGKEKKTKGEEGRRDRYQPRSFF